MRTILTLISIGLVALLAACGTGQQTPTADVVITSPQPNAQIVTGSPVVVEGTVVEGAEVTVSIGSAAPVAATLLAPASGRRPWHAEVTAPAVGSATITATATGAGFGSAEAEVPVSIVALQPFGMWQGMFTIDRRPNGGELEEGGTMVVWYGTSWWRMYFAHAAIEVYGTTSGWDLVDNSGFRLVGTYHAAGETNQDGYVMDEPWVDYYAVLSNGDIIEGTVELDD